MKPMSKDSGTNKSKPRECRNQAGLGGGSGAGGYAGGEGIFGAVVNVLQTEERPSIRTR
jgi:hypothetical protein